MVLPRSLVLDQLETSDVTSFSGTTSPQMFFLWIYGLIGQHLVGSAYAAAQTPLHADYSDSNQHHRFNWPIKEVAIVGAGVSQV